MLPNGFMYNRFIVGSKPCVNGMASWSDSRTRVTEDPPKPVIGPENPTHTCWTDGFTFVASGAGLLPVTVGAGPPGAPAVVNSNE